MNNRLTRHRNRRSRMRTFFSATDNQPLVDAAQDIKDLKDAFVVADTAWKKQAGEIDTLENNDNATTKATALQAMADEVCRRGLRCLVKARTIDSNLATLLDHSPSDLTQMDVSAAIDLAKAMRNGLNDHKADFSVQGITQAVIDNIDHLISAAIAVKDLPVSNNNTLSALREQQTAGDAGLEHQLEDVVMLLKAEYGGTKPEFVKAMLSQYELGGDTGKRYTGIEGIVKGADDTPHKGYTVRRADDAAKAAVTDMSGAYSIKGMKSGQVTFELLDGSGNVVTTKLLKLKLGTVTVWDWVVG